MAISDVELNIVFLQGIGERWIVGGVSGADKSKRLSPLLERDHPLVVAVEKVIELLEQQPRKEDHA